MREEAILHSEMIKRHGESKYFQIVLPTDTTRIIGVEASAIRKASGASTSDMYFMFGTAPVIIPVAEVDIPFKIRVAETVGRLTLHIPDATSIFYQDDIRQKDISPKYADFTQYPAVFGEWSHNSKRHENSINVPNCANMIEGHFKDSWGALFNYHVIYQLNIIIWIEKSFS